MQQITHHSASQCITVHPRGNFSRKTREGSAHPLLFAVALYANTRKHYATMPTPWGPTWGMELTGFTGVIAVSGQARGSWGARRARGTLSEGYGCRAERREPGVTQAGLNSLRKGMKGVLGMSWDVLKYLGMSWNAGSWSLEDASRHQFATSSGPSVWVCLHHLTQ